MTSLNEAQKSAAATEARRAFTRRVLMSILDYGVMLLLALFFLFPLVFMIVSSLKQEEYIMQDLQSVIYAFVPRHLTLNNYTCPGNDCSWYGETLGGVFQRIDYIRVFFNSVLIVTGTVIVGLFVNSMAAYSLARLRWRGRKFLLAIIIALIIIPFESIAVPLLLIVNGWGWQESYRVQMVPFMADAFSIYLFYQFFIGIPKDFDEAALVDGAGPFRIYWNVILPLARPVFATVAILQFLFRWADYMWPLMTIRFVEFRPLNIASGEFFGQYPRVWGQIMAFASLSTVPVLIIFLMFQKWFVQSVASSGVKG